MLFDNASLRAYSTHLLPHEIVFLNRHEFKRYINNRNLSDVVCGRDENGELNIGSEYGRDVMDRLHNNDPALDILAIVPRNQLDHVLGFILCELGECKVEPNVWSVNLICMTKTIVKASLLLGAMMFCIKRKPQYDPGAILELAGGYSNLAGFISYTKMGFNRDLDLLIGKDICFHDVTNLPMSVDISSISFSEIKRRAAGMRTRIVTHQDDPTGLYNNVSRMTPAESKREATACNLSYQIELYERDPSLFHRINDADLIRKINQANAVLHPSFFTRLLNYVRDMPVKMPDLDWYDVEHEKRGKIAGNRTRKKYKRN